MNLNNLPEDILEYILSLLDHKDCFNLRAVNKEFMQLCSGFVNTLKHIILQQSSSIKCLKLYYLFDLSNNPNFENINYIWWVPAEEIVIMAAKINSIELLNWGLLLGANNYQDIAIIGAMFGHYSFVKYLLKNIKYNFNHVEIVFSAIKHNKYNEFAPMIFNQDYTSKDCIKFWMGSISSGNYYKFLWFWNKLTEIDPDLLKENLDVNKQWIFDCITTCPNTDIIDFLIEQIGDLSGVNFTISSIFMVNNNIKSLEYLFEKFDIKVEKKILTLAARLKFFEHFKLFEKHYSEKLDHEILVASSGSTQLFNYVKNKVDPISSELKHKIFISACLSRNLTIVQEYKGDYNFDEIITEYVTDNFSKKFHDKKIFKILLNEIRNNIELINSLFTYSIDNNLTCLTKELFDICEKKFTYKIK